MNEVELFMSQGLDITNYSGKWKSAKNLAVEDEEYNISSVNYWLKVRKLFIELGGLPMPELSNNDQDQERISDLQRRVSNQNDILKRAGIEVIDCDCGNPDCKAYILNSKIYKYFILEELGGNPPKIDNDLLSGSNKEIGILVGMCEIIISKAAEEMMFPYCEPSTWDVFISKVKNVRNIIKASHYVTNGRGMKSLEEVAKAHDLLVAYLLEETPIELSPKVRLGITAACDVLCWLLNHDHNIAFAQNLEILKEKAE